MSHPLDALVAAFLESGGAAIFSSPDHVRFGPTAGTLLDILLAWERGETPAGLPKYWHTCEQIARLERTMRTRANQLLNTPDTPTFALFWASSEGNLVRAIWSRDHTRQSATEEVIAVIERKLVTLR